MPRPGSGLEDPVPRASVVVLNHDGRRFLDPCLCSLLEQRFDGGFEVIVADNGSTDGSVEHVRERFPGVRVLELGRNLGFSAANNAAVRAARGDLVALLNNDTRARPAWLAALVEAAAGHPRAGAVTSKLVFMDRPGVIQNAGSLLLSDGSGADRGFGEPDRGQYDRLEEVFAACGNGMLLRREAVEEVGGFDETFFAYYEDTDLSWRLRLHGWSVIYQPAAVVEHVHAGTNVEGSAFFVFHANRNRVFMLLKNARPGFAARSLLALAARAARGGGRRGGQAGPGRGRGPGRAIQLRVLASVARHLPEMLRKRRRIRRWRTVADAEIERWTYPRASWDERGPA